MNCNHKTINIYPTEENSWGINDRYTVSCNTCKTTLIDNATTSELIQYIGINKSIIASGFKYLPQISEQS